MTPESDAGTAADTETTGQPPVETTRPGMVQLLETEPTQGERRSHAAELLWLIDHPDAWQDRSA